MVLWGFVLSLVGFCGITAIIGVILGAVGRGQAKLVGKGVGMSTAAIAIGAGWLVLGLVGGVIGAVTGGSEDRGGSTQPTSVPTNSDQSPAQPAFASLGITITELPVRWNRAIEAYGEGEPLPLQIPTTDSDLPGLPGYSESRLEVSNGNFVTIFWWTESGDVTEINLGGDASQTATATNVLANAAAMTYATTDLSIPAAEQFVIQELIGDSLSDAGNQSFVSELVEEPGRVYRFTLAGGQVDFSLVGTNP